MNKGFTLIELLAVIVVLAVIALIATPIIVNIINDARDSAKQRSLELYKDAITSKIVASQLTDTPVKAGNLSSEFLQTVQYDGERISCTTNILNTDGTIYLAGCTIGNSTKLYSYGNEVYVQVYQPQYYFSTEDDLGDFPWGDELSVLNPVFTDDPQEIRNSGKKYYFGFSLNAAGKVEVGYICIYRNNKEYCVSEYGDNNPNIEEYANQKYEIISSAFSDIPNACTTTPQDYQYDNVSYTYNAFECLGDNIRFSFYTGYSEIGPQDYSSWCSMDAEGFWCIE